jgi:2-(1,2-epoxy-1,2-dihydrophenyl)acetyl-CoA isomerase
MIWKCVDDDLLAVETDGLAERFRHSSRGALRIVKKRLREAAGLSLDQALDAERDDQGVLGKSPDYREAVTAFLAKRSPNFD